MMQSYENFAEANFQKFPDRHDLLGGPVFEITKEMGNRPIYQCGSGGEGVYQFPGYYGSDGGIRATSELTAQGKTLCGYYSHNEPCRHPFAARVDRFPSGSSVVAVVAQFLPINTAENWKFLYFVEAPYGSIMVQPAGGNRNLRWRRDGQWRRDRRLRLELHGCRVW